MRRRVVAAVVAVLLAAVGGVLVLAYASTADQRALAGMQTVDVLVTTATVPQDTAAEDLRDLVRLQQLPAMAVPDGALSTLAEVQGLVTSTELQPGEQVLAARFADPAAQAQQSEVEVPQGLQQVSVLLDPQRVVGGEVAPGDLVGVLISLDEPARTHLALQEVLVTRVQGGYAPPADGEAEEAAAEDAAPLPESSLLVTLAVDGGQTERLVFGAEHGTVWLSLQDEDVDQSDTDVITDEEVYE
ncbi:Flp pilus assembly protein CpaB [Auraticoccus monumenti]|uniref:Pilus assembly protein CpaB n=1 Tax=Auraticoccus monumenti TaxID=675864 RepID=A0A1G6YB71_9ACTN|nr:RcpC/CpaB family pilus assembly protein [Auraticoccus monumenti]SDD87600.1 pilus assembly protein CpaB [Auraticoccus monumenti]